MDENIRADQDGAVVKWMSSKMRMMQRMMMVSDQTGSDLGGKLKFEEQRKPLLIWPLGTDDDDNSSNNCSNHSNITIRACADCHTTKTPLWRSSLCNTCGIRQRKARRAVGAASANGTVLVAAEASCVKRNKLHNKEEKLKIECTPRLKKKPELVGAKASSRGRNKFGLEGLRLRLSKFSLRMKKKLRFCSRLYLMALELVK